MEIKVSSKSEAKSVAGMIFAMIKENEETFITAIGAGAVNQSIKAVIVANGFLAPHGKRIKIEPCFSQAIIDDGEVSAIKLKLIVEE